MNKLKYFIMCCFFSFGQVTESKSQASIYDVNIRSIYGDDIDLSQYKGKKILFVNVASNCGFTGQYKELEELHQQYKDKLVVIGVPCNQFGGQEPGDNEEIVQFCKQNYGVSFLLTEKVDVKGENQHPLYTWICNKKVNGKSSSSVKWNFQKYLIDENGEFITFFYSKTKPMSDKITSYVK